MKILHIVSGDLSGGAARGAYWLHRGLVDLNINSKLFTNSRITLDDENVITTVRTKKEKITKILFEQFDNLFTYIYPKRKKVIFSSAICGVDFTKTQAYKEADIIHLHWINGGFVNIRHLAKIDKPVVWTMRDMWPFTGGCHYSMGCERYQNGCGNCEQLKSSYKYDLSRFVFNRKSKYLSKNIKIVGISYWLTQ